MKTPLTIAFIGIGHVAQYQLRALALSPDWRLIAAADTRPQQANLLPTGVAFYHSAHELLENADPDIVLVSTPNRTHFQLGLEVLEHGRNLLLEKPCCDNHAQLAELTDAARRGDQFFSVALHAAHALDLEWTLINLPNFDLGPLTRFSCGFYDPYIVAGSQQESAHSLGGSWFDSGINALSVIGRLIDPDKIRISEARITRIGAIGCDDVQASVDFEYDLDSTGVGHGEIETNWTLNINRKRTHLYFDETGCDVLLDHSREQVVVRRGPDVLRSIDLRTDESRLVNHYQGVFADAANRLQQNRPNLSWAVQLHRLLFDAEGFTLGSR